MAVDRSVDPETHEMYLKGMYHLNKFTPEGIQKGLQYLHQAVEKTPDEPLAHAGLALAYNLISHMPAPPPDAVPKARAATERALELDPNLAEAQLSLAMISIYTDWDRSLAKRAYERALELNPSLAMAHAHFCFCLTAEGEVKRGLSELHQAQKLDPLHPMYPGWLGESYYVFGDFERAIEESKKALELNPDLPIGLFSLGSAYARKGMFEDALELHKRVAELSPSYRFALGETYALAGRRDEARKIVADLESQPSVWDSWGIALIYQALGETDNAFHWLEVAYRQRHPYVQWFRMPRNFRDLSEDPRYGDLAKRLNLPDV
jgi:serine/threonine-protein kinase